MTIARFSLHDLSQPGWYHCVSRCVRRAFLCGTDYGGRSVEHRKLSIRKRLRYLVDFFSAEVGGYAVMSNHVHVVVRMDPEQVAAWSDRQVAERWCALYPGDYDANGLPLPAPETMIAGFAAIPDQVAKARQRLGNLSWFIRALKEPIAHRVNKEDDCSGAFWQARFTSVALLDQAALAACLVYVDLNPIRAKVRQEQPVTRQQGKVIIHKTSKTVVQTPEQSDFTSVQERIEVNSPAVAVASQERRTHIVRQAIESERAPQELSLSRGGNASREKDQRWLARIESMIPGTNTTWYLNLVEHTARLVHPKKPGHMPAELPPLLERLNLAAADWHDTMRSPSQMLGTALGHAAARIAEAARRGSQWVSIRCWLFQGKRIIKFQMLAESMMRPRQSSKTLLTMNYHIGVARSYCVYYDHIRNKVDSDTSHIIRCSSKLV